eukprot:g18837.t1
MAASLGSSAAAAGVGDGAVGCQQRTLIALPDAMLSEVMGNLGVKCLGRASCACRCLRATVADERLWMALWKGPLPGGFRRGGKAAHAALWLLAKGEVEQTRVAVCEPASPMRTTTRRRVGDAGPAAAAFNGSAAGGSAVAVAAAAAAAAGFPVHVSCMAINGGVIATAAGPEITVWDLDGAAPRARFNVSGHGSVTCLLLRHSTLLAGDNSGYLRSYDVRTAGGRPLHEIRTHTDRVTAMDAFTVLPDGSTGDACSSSGAAQSAGTRSPGGGGAVGQHQRRCDQGHGWGEGWPEGNQEERRDAPSAAAAALAAAAPPTPSQPGSSNSSSNSSSSGGGGGGGGGGGASPSPYVASPSGAGGAAAAAGGGTGRGGGRGHGSVQQGYASSRSHGAGFGFGGGSGGGSGLDGLGEPLSRLGKRQGYAGRGQGDEPWDVASASASAAAGTLMQQQQQQQPRGGEIGGGRWGWGGGGSGAAIGWDEEDQKEEDECCGGEGQRPWSVAGNRERARANGIGGGGGGRGGNQTLLITGSDDGTAKAWDAKSGRFVHVYAGHTRGVTCLQAAFTESYGPVLVTGGGDSAVIIWELPTGRCLEKLETGAGLVTNPGGAGPRVGCLQAYRNSIVVGEDRHVSVWSLRKGQRPRLARASFCEHQRPIRRLELTGRWIVTCSGDYVIRLWDSKTGVCIRELGTKSGAAITSFRLYGLCLLSTSLFDASVLMTTFLPRRERVP